MVLGAGGQHCLSNGVHTFCGIRSDALFGTMLFPAIEGQICKPQKCGESIVSRSTLIRMHSPHEREALRQPQ